MRRVLLGLGMVALAACGSSGGSHAAKRGVVHYDNLGMTASTGAACQTEQEVFRTAIQAYRASNDGAYPSGATAQEIANSLVRHQLLTSARLKRFDNHNPPAAFHWYYDRIHSTVVPGPGCY